MPDERQDSTVQGIAPAPESAIGAEADRRRRERIAREPVESRPDAGVGGTSDSDSAADEAWAPGPDKPEQP